MRTLANALAFTRSLMGRGRIHTMMAGFNQSAIHAECLRPDPMLSLPGVNESSSRSASS